ncbi:MAG: class I SAM-dependent methyltransferase [Nitrospinae bacterium]|nr:class I SAM-dependent methyltransferase [Nitrospinota bacterium]
MKCEPETPQDYLSPKEVINKHSVEELCNTAEDYYKNTDPERLMARPLESVKEAPYIFYRLGLIFSGMHLGATMKVLEFGAGSCWLSRMLNQMGCSTISVDVSSTALDIGKKLFLKFPPIGGCSEEPQFVRFDGYTIDLPDESVERIICFDCFHHIPNQKEVLKEFYRVLKPSGIVGFSEPARAHSKNAHSQLEMKNYTVLENDILIEEIYSIAMEIGFSNMYAKPTIHLPYEIAYKEFFNIIFKQRLSLRTLSMLFDTMRDLSVTFFLNKGDFIPDSRIGEGFQAEIQVSESNAIQKGGKALLPISVNLKNYGESIWLAKNGKHMIGVVRFGAHLYDDRGKIVDIDWFRASLPKDVYPKDVVNLNLEVPLPKEKGNYVLIFDLVCEDICWFESCGNIVSKIKVQVD